MTIEILGRREDQRLELESKDALDDPGKIAREVVGLLNAGGGEIWIGVEEEEGVAVAIDPVSDPERAIGRLWDFLVDALDPSPTAEEVSIAPVPTGAESALVVVKARPTGERSGRLPYAFRKAGGWHFVRRAGARNHPMSREEIFGRPVPRGDEALAGIARALEEDRQKVRDAGESGLWLAFQPERKLEIDPEDPRFDRIVTEPSLTGNRRTGWHFARSSRKPKLIKDGLEWGFWSEVSGDYVERARATSRGALRFGVSLDRLLLAHGEREIAPFKLLEYAVSSFRIARVVYEGHLDPDDRLLVDLALFGVAGLGLRQGTPDDFFFGNDLGRTEEPDLIWDPIALRFREIDEAPDRCGVRMVRRVYHAFGWRESDMPRQYDRETGRLILPE